MTINYRHALSVLELVVYLPCFFVALFIAIRHGFGRSSGWIYFVLFTVIRIVGSATSLASISNPSKGLITAATICTSIGLSPLILGCVGLLSRVNESMISNFKAAVHSLFFRIVTLVTIIALILCLVGGIDTTSSTSGDDGKIDSKTKIGVLIFVVSYIGLCLLYVMVGIHVRGAEKGEKRLIIAVAVSIPLILVRLIYSILTAYSKNPSFNFFTGSVTLKLVMSTLEEFLVVITCLGIGLTLHVVSHSERLPPRSMASGRGAQHNKSLADDDTAYTNAGAFQANSPPNAFYPDSSPRKAPSKLARGGPISQLVALGMNRYGSR